MLTDLEDESVYMTGQFFRDSAINPCIESSYRFIDALMSNVVIMHRVIVEKISIYICLVSLSGSVYCLLSGDTANLPMFTPVWLGFVSELGSANSNLEMSIIGKLIKLNNFKYI